MVNLKELKDALNSFDDDEMLKNIEANNTLSCEFEEADTSIGLVFYDDEDKFGYYLELISKLDVVKSFVDSVVSATKQSMAAEQDDDYKEYLSEMERF